MSFRASFCTLMLTFFFKLLIFSLLLSSLSYGALGVPSLEGHQRYDEICWACSHNSMNNKEDGWVLPNQTFSLKHQLEQGIHAQMWDVWMDKNQVVLQHGAGLASLLGQSDLAPALAGLKTYLDKNKEAVITLIFESYVPALRLAQEIEKAGLEPYAHTQIVGEKWPTLQEMRAKNRRLVLFVDRHEADAPSWLLPLWKHAFDTPWEASKPEDLKNTVKRGSPQNSLLIVNHFLASPFPSPENSLKANQPDFIQKRFADIEKTLEHRPNFWVLDFYHLLNAHKAVP